jgi:hypothetical protein
LDDSFLSRLHLAQRQLLGTSITSQTGHALRLHAARFQPITEVSADGRHFPTDPSEFRAEVARQAAELYAGRAGLTMDIQRLRYGATRGHSPSADTPDFMSRSESIRYTIALWSLMPPLSLSCPENGRHNPQLQMQARPVPSAKDLNLLPGAWPSRPVVQRPPPPNQYPP